MKYAQWFCAFVGCLGFMDWVISGALYKHDPSNYSASLGAAPWMLYVSLFFMALGLLFAWFSGVAAEQSPDNSVRGRVARRLRLVK